MINTYNNVMENNKFNKKHGGCKECRILEVYNNKQECVLAFNNGKIGVMDYYRIQNVMADTEMRKSISKPQQQDDQSSDE